MRQDTDRILEILETPDTGTTVDPRNHQRK
jgi:hypothetical protein